MRYGLLARVSSEEQVEGYSLDAQIRAFRSLVEARGGTVYKEWVEEGVSAHTDDITTRPLFREAIDEALAHRYDVLVVHKLDRFARNTQITLQSLDKLAKAGIGFVSIGEQMDFTTPIGKVMLTNLAAFGQYHSDNLSLEVKKGLRERVAQGLWNGPIPFGYEKGDDRSLAIIQEEASLLTRMFEMYASGNYTDQMIATWLNQTEHKPRSMRRDRQERNYIWNKDSVRNILRNEFYLGRIKHQGEMRPGKQPAIVSQELFDSAMRMRKVHYTGPSTFAKRYRPYLLKGLLRCVTCGGKVWSQYINGHEYYREENSSRGIDCSSGRAYHRAEVFDDQISEVVEKLTLPESWRDLVTEYLGSGEERAQVANESRRLQEKLKRTKYQFREGDIDQREYEQEMALTNAALEAAEPHADDHVIQLGDHIEGLVEAWAMATKEERHQLLTIMLDAVYVDMKSAEVVGVKPKPEFLPLFNLKEPVRSGKTVLVTSGMDQSGSLP